ncbi:hypothetical protein GE061_020265 [Apolygus lucorum]|uniref:Uncharacterized protein n=1 Tax=Apolygus lucorum TaxID=248454 RepID=A0A8S9WM86_APOLU|nr:hypothetical protein GE061_020265 [Apolygus lucorum]
MLQTIIRCQQKTHLSRMFKILQKSTRYGDSSKISHRKGNLKSHIICKHPSTKAEFNVDISVVQLVPENINVAVIYSVTYGWSVGKNSNSRVHVVPTRLTGRKI